MFPPPRVREKSNSLPLGRRSFGGGETEGPRPIQQLHPALATIRLRPPRVRTVAQIQRLVNTPPVKGEA